LFFLTMMVAVSVQSRSILQRDGEEWVTALMRAARGGERKNVKALLEQGVDIDARDPSGGCWWIRMER
jgi:ankyrin repeat protein